MFFCLCLITHKKFFSSFWTFHENFFLDVFKRILLKKHRMAVEALHTFDFPLATIWMHHHERLLARQATANP